jgi:HK97 family phage portal protein/HK97 family phage prohead protease
VSQSRTIADRIADGWRWIIRRLQVVEEPEQIRYGHAWSQELGVQQPYPAVNSMSAFGKFPWIYAAVEAVATDIAGLPLQVRRLVGDRNRAVQRHPFLRLMERPTSSTGPTLWRRQMIVDLLLTGNYFALILGRGSSVTSLVRLHPEHVQIIPSSSGGVAAYRYTEEGVSTDYSPDDVIHVRQTSYRDGPQSLYGQGVIEVLETELTGEYAASQRWRDEAGRGQPTMTISPKDGASIRPDVLEKLVASIQRHANRTGIVPIGGPVDITQLPFNARDMEFSAARDWTRASILAVVGVAYVRLFLPSANFATAKQQNRIYWQNLLGLIALVEDALSVVAVRMGRVSDRVAHDTSNVEALQESRTDRMTRAALLVEKFGIEPIAALQVEGFTEIDETMLQPASQPAAAPEPEPEVRNVLPFQQRAVPYAVRYQTSVDERVCEICGPEHDEVYMVRPDGSHDGPELPRHPQCRCFYRAVTEEDLKSLITRPTPAKYDHIDFSPTAGMVEEAERAVRWIEEGLAGDGMVQSTKVWARKVANGEPVTFEKARKMRAWFARHESDQEGEGFNPGEPGYPSPGRVAWAAWFGDPGRSWADKVGRQMDAADEAEKEQSRRHVAAKEADVRHNVGVTLKRLQLAADEEEPLIQSVFRFVASTAEVDRMGDVVEQSWHLDSYKRNPVILWNHDSTRPPIARATAVEVVDGQLEIEMEFDLADPFAAEVAGKIQRGFINAGSVGFFPGAVQYRSELPKDDPRYDPKSFGIVASENELVEFSITPVPANGSALIAASADAADEDLRRLLANETNRRRLRALLGVTSTPEPDALSWLQESPTQATGLPFLKE